MHGDRIQEVALAPQEVGMSTRISQQQLESYLWGAARPRHVVMSTHPMSHIDVHLCAIRFRTCFLLPAWDDLGLWLCQIDIAERWAERFVVFCHLFTAVKERDGH